MKRCPVFIFSLVLLLLWSRTTTAFSHRHHLDVGTNPIIPRPDTSRCSWPNSFSSVDSYKRRRLRYSLDDIRDSKDQQLRQQELLEEEEEEEDDTDQENVLELDDDTDDDDDDTDDVDWTPSVDSPLSQHARDDDSTPSRSFYHRYDDESLEKSTLDLLDEAQYPVGTLMEEDVDLVASFMAAWARRRSVLAALMVERLLKRIVDDMRAQNPVAHVNTRFYTYAIDAWARSGAAGSAQRAQTIHDAMVKMYNETADPRIAPTVMSYNALMYAWDKSRDRKAARMADRVLMEMIDSYRYNSHRGNNENTDDASNTNKLLKPDAVSFSTVMNAYAKSSLSNRVHRCEELFELMDELGVRRNVYTFSALQNVYARSGERDAPKRAKKVLDDMIKLYKQGDIFAKPNTVNYNDVLNAYSRTPGKKSAQEASEMLQRMATPVSEGGYDVEPDRLSYALTILTCARCPDLTFGAELALANLLKLEDRAQLEAKRRKEISSAAPPAVHLDIESFNVVLMALSRSRLPNAPELALRLVERMEKYAEKGEEEVRPNIRTWNAVLNTYAKAVTPKNSSRAREAEEILDRISEQHKRGFHDFHPNAFTFAAVLNAYQRSSDPSAAERADAIVRRMEEFFDSGISQTPPDVFHYTIVCGAWAKSGSEVAADRCLQILMRMYERDQKGYPKSRPNVRTYNAVLDCLAKSGEEERAEQLLYYMLSCFKKGDTPAMPDTFSFNCVIQAFCRSRKRGSGRRAEAILDRFLEFEEEHPSVKPDARSFTHIIAHWCSRSSNELDAPYRAEYLLNRMVSLYKGGRTNLAPNLYAITSVIDSYSRANHIDAGRNAERLLKLVRDLGENYNVPDMVVTTEIMNSVLFAWANSGDENAGHRAMAHLEDMEMQYRSGCLELRPDTKSYGYVLSAWTKSSSPDKARRALQVLRRMEQQQNDGNKAVLVDEHAYSLVINACAFCNAGSDAEHEAFDIAVSLFDQMLSSTDRKPSSLAYGWFIQACGRLRVSETIKAAAIDKAFTHCCKDGLVNDFVLHRLRGATTDDLFASVFRQLKIPTGNKYKVTLSQMPLAWRRNCKAKSKLFQGKQGTNYSTSGP